MDRCRSGTAWSIGSERPLLGPSEMAGAQFNDHCMSHCQREVVTVVAMDKNARLAVNPRLAAGGQPVHCAARSYLPLCPALTKGRPIAYVTSRLVRVIAVSVCTTSRIGMGSGLPWPRASDLGARCGWSRCVCCFCFVHPCVWGCCGRF